MIVKRNRQIHKTKNETYRIIECIFQIIQYARFLICIFTNHGYW